MSEYLDTYDLFNSFVVHTRGLGENFVFSDSPGGANAYDEFNNENLPTLDKGAVITIINNSGRAGYIYFRTPIANTSFDDAMGGSTINNSGFTILPYLYEGSVVYYAYFGGDGIGMIVALPPNSSQANIMPFIPASGQDVSNLNLSNISIDVNELLTVPINNLLPYV